jgi:hypothetical protein
MIESETNTPRRSGVLAMRSFMMLRAVIGLPSATLSADMQRPIFRSQHLPEPLGALIEPSR